MAKGLTKESLKQTLNSSDLLIIVMLIKRFVGKNKDIVKFLNKIDEPDEIEKLYEAILTLVNLVNSKDEVE